MRIHENNITFNKNIIKECISELKSINNKELYFNNLVQERLNKCNNVYINEFNDKLDQLVEKVNEANDIRVISKSVIKLTNLLSSLCNTEITLYKALEGEINNE